MIVQYLRYMNNLLHGNLGYSYAENQSVAALFEERLARSIYLSGISLLIAMIIALPLGIFQAVKRNTLGDNVATSVAFILYSMPLFFLGLILIQVFALSLPIFNFEASQSTNVCRGHGRLALHVAADPDARADHRWPPSPGTCGPRPSTCWPRTTSRWPGPRACPSGWS